ncbi:calcium/calmodulin-dependent protein kinase type IV-like [Anopheles moucheti]|uniref:calcium/calmodulin-dependent protein kinase type IV-like n=1 Tax=Anopheles moucheti TaxID=186751 RepID=UPI0022F03466|nr:calcium/calmodulin-dependent protein kinase type IV-like [Anopheles moucheti]XP_052900262.1 calcium/calmodulin-dependent protein kinase type IV-like [Anopheles moucheti]
MQLPEGFSHVGDGRLCISEELLLELKSKRDIHEVYQVADTWIAKGMYGIVRGAVSKQSGISYAAKFLRRRRRGQCCLSEINHEIAVLMLCADSDHVVKLQAVHETRSECALILELATGGELQSLIDDQGQLMEQTTRVCMREILRALQHMHSKSIAHLDLKPQNILLVGKSVDDGLKLCDFGLARFIAEKNKIYEIVGTPDYVAPEVLHYNPLSLKSDIWSIGVLAYVLLTGLSPFGGENKQETFLNVTKCSLTFPDDLFRGISSDAVDFIKSALRIMPKDRLTVEECLEHRWLKEDTVWQAEERLAARASAAHNKSGTRAVNGNGIASGSNAAVVEHGNGYGMQPLPVVECGGINRANVATEELCELLEGDGDGGGGGIVVGGGGTGRKSSPPAEPKLTQRDIITNGEENKENVIVGSVRVSQSLFPDAPTTPKVSRKTLPAKTPNEGNPVAYLHRHHFHHHHHHYNHQAPQYLLPNSFIAQQIHRVLNHNLSLAKSAGSDNSSSNGGSFAFATRQGSSSGVNNFVQNIIPVMQRSIVAGSCSSDSSGCSSDSSIEVIFPPELRVENVIDLTRENLTPPVKEWNEPDAVNDSSSTTTNGCTNGTNTSLPITLGDVAASANDTNTSFSAVAASTVSSSCRSTATTTVRHTAVLDDDDKYAFTKF